jgi:hypothetical protein
MTATTTTKAAQDYLDAVERELIDLPAEERAELLEDLSLHLSELQQEGDDRSLESRLGSAADYASELRSAAGLPPRTASPRVRLRSLRRAGRQLWSSGAARETRTFLPTLAPAWWVLRGYLVVLLPALRHTSRSHDFPVPAPYNSRALGIALVIVAVLASIAVGRRKLPRPAALLMIALNLVLAAAALNVAGSAPSRLATHTVRLERLPDPSLVVSPLATRHGPVTNIFPYSADGKLLTGVLLYDQDGRPLYVGKQLWFADRCAPVSPPPVANDGVPIPQSYPQNYTLLGTVVGTPFQPVAQGQCKPVPIPKVVLPLTTTPRH